MSRPFRLLGGAAALAFFGCPRALPAEETRLLAPGAAVERSLAGPAVHRYGIALEGGQFCRVQVEQNHVDLAVRVLSPAGAVLAEADNAIDREDPLTLSFVAARGGAHRVEVRLRSARTAFGRYRVSIEPPRAAGAEDEKRLAAERLRGEADKALGRGDAASLRAAHEACAKALAVWREIGDRREEAATVGRMSDILGMLGELREALARSEEALALRRALGDRQGEAAALDRLGLAHSEVGDQRRALEYLEEALALRRAGENGRGQAETLNDIAVARGALGEIPEAIARYTESLEFGRRSGDRLIEAMVLKNRAVDYLVLGELDRAADDLRDALARFRVLGDRHLQGITQYHLGDVALDRGNAPDAVRRYRAAIALLKETGDKRFEGITWNHLGLADLDAGRPEAALRNFRTSRELLLASDDRRGESIVSANIGRALLDAGEPVAARDWILEALPRVQASADRRHETMALLHLARAERALGNLDASRERLEEALRLTESLRGSIPGPGERASFLAKTRERYELLIDLLMELHAKRPGEGWDAQALQASERARARTLVELLAEARVNVREGIDQVLLGQERALEEELEERRRAEQRRLSGAGPAPARAAARPLEAVLADYQDVQSRLRAASPRYAALARPQPLSLEEIRKEVLDGDTVLLEYSLGEKRSFLWAVTVDSLDGYELPGRAAVEAEARRLYAAWSAGSGAEPGEAARRARRVARMLLGPAAHRLRGKRLAIVAEGALQYLPFGALPSPRDPSIPLAAEHEIVSLPSATTLAVLRRESAQREPATRRVAILADPVFDGGDPRVAGGRPRASAPSGPESDALTRSMAESGLRRLERLTASRREAEAVVALAGRGAFAALDFDASRETALGAEVSGAEIVHFASHGLLNSRHPELSGIVLSLVDRKGRPRDGFLQTRDIYKLRLSADLVVLSACQTALGKEVRGEGLLGLSRGFMYAGAPRVVASLWKVPDRATAELMKRFYRGMLVQGLRPAAALAAAQRAIRRDRLWADPYYWAAFTLQGDWN